MTVPTYPNVDALKVVGDLPFDPDIIEVLVTKFDGTPPYLADEERERLYENQRAVFAFGIAYSIASQRMPYADRRTIAEAALEVLESAGLSDGLAGLGA